MTSGDIALLIIEIVGGFVGVVIVLALLLAWLLDSEWGTGK